MKDILEFFAFTFAYIVTVGFAIMFLLFIATVLGLK